MEPMHQRPQPDHDREPTQKEAGKEMEASPSSDPLNTSWSSRRPGRASDFTVKAPDDSTYAKAIQAAVDAGLNIQGTDWNKKTISIKGPIDPGTLDSLVNDLGCTVTPVLKGKPGDMFTQAIPEEGSGRPIMTTMALGEESQGWPPPATTQAIPEEGIGRPDNDEDHFATTCAVGEEGQGR